MAREKNPNREKAKELWLSRGGDITNRQIAEVLGEDEKKVAVWKQRDKWKVVQQNIDVVQHKKSVVQHQKDEKISRHKITASNARKADKTLRGRGAPKGNKNAIGNNGGPPIGSKNALKTGEYETIWLDCLTEEEKQLYEKIDLDTLTLVNEDIRLITIRERRMMERIRQLMDGLTEKERKVLSELRDDKQVINLYDEKTGTNKPVLVPLPRMMITEISETEYRKIDDILKVEEALTRIQEKKAKLLALKHEIELTEALDMEKLKLSKARLLLDIEKAKGENKENLHVDALRKKMAERKMKNGCS